MKPLDFSRRGNPVKSRRLTLNHGLGSGKGQRYVKPVDDAMADNTIISKDFDKFQIDPAELRASVDAGRRGRPGAE